MVSHERVSNIMTIPRFVCFRNSHWFWVSTVSSINMVTSSCLNRPFQKTPVSYFLKQITFKIWHPGYSVHLTCMYHHQCLRIFQLRVFQCINVWPTFSPWKFHFWTSPTPSPNCVFLTRDSTSVQSEWLASFLKVHNPWSELSRCLTIEFHQFLMTTTTTTTLLKITRTIVYTRLHLEIFKFSKCNRDQRLMISALDNTAQLVTTCSPSSSQIHPTSNAANKLPFPILSLWIWSVLKNFKHLYFTLHVFQI